jgi:hypothetical protein
MSTDEKRIDPKPERHHVDDGLSSTFSVGAVNTAHSRSMCPAHVDASLDEQRDSLSASIIELVEQ